jgi:tellurite methyltransferase
MPHKDALRWNERYLIKYLNSFPIPRALLLENSNLLPHRGLAFDAAMGLGSNAEFLTELGMDVIGVDISDVAVQKAKQSCPKIKAVVADLNLFYLPSAKFDVILNFYFLLRNLWPLYVQSLKPGGVLFFETLTIDMLQTYPDLDPTHLLEKDELRLGFKELEILEYREGWIHPENGHSRSVASLIGRKSL